MVAQGVISNSWNFTDTIPAIQAKAGLMSAVQPLKDAGSRRGPLAIHKKALFVSYMGYVRVCVVRDQRGSILVFLFWNNMVKTC